MALFDKLFSTKRKLDYGIRESRDRSRSRKLTPDQVRLLLFKECDWRGRKLLFDSSTIERVPAGKNDKPCTHQTNQEPYIVEVSNGFSYVYKGPATDASALGEMIFGAVAINYKSVSLKLHIMEKPKRLMCTKLFCVPSSRRVVRRPTDAGSRSRPVAVPPAREEVSLSFSFDRADSGFYGEHSMHSSVSSTCDFFSMMDNGTQWDGNNSQDDFYTFHAPPGRKLSTSSTGSWQRRTFRNMATKFDLGSQSSNFLNVPTAASNITSCDSQIYNNSSTSGTSDSLNSGGSNPPVVKRNKLGLALLITVTDSDEMELVRRCVEHSSQLQALVCRLRLATIAAGGESCFVATLYKAATDAATWLTDLMYGPRVQPLWLSIAGVGSTGAGAGVRDVSKKAEGLMSDLCAVLAAADTKQTNFFMSTLLTHVLTHHLGWVSTVSPYDVIGPQANVTEGAARPYNALWAQLGDLCGSIGFPPRAAKTIITGHSVQFVNRLLLVLTYFVRCGEVKRNDFEYRNSVLTPAKVINVTPKTGLSRTSTKMKLNGDASSETLSEVSVKRSITAKLCDTLSTGFDDRPMSSRLRKSPTVGLSLKSDSSSSLNSSESEVEQKRVVFVLGDDERLVGLKNKSNGGKSVKKSKNEVKETITKDECDEKHPRSTESPSKCCGQTNQHSKPIRHSGFKFEFDKYPQIVTNYMKSKNLEILDRHYIGKPGNLKLDNYQFDPTIVPPIPEERCEICYKCQLMEATLQTPTNASELEFMNDMPRISEPQYAEQLEVADIPISPKSFVRKRKENTVIVNVVKCSETESELGVEKESGVRKVIEFGVPLAGRHESGRTHAGFEATLLGGVTDHYVPDLVLQGTQAKPAVWETELKRDLDLISYLNKTQDAPVQAVAIIGDTNTWEVRVVGRDGTGPSGMSALVGAMLDALPHMWRAKVPPHQCISFLEAKLREFCVLSKTLADMLMSTDFCDIATLTKSLNIDINDIPLLMAVASTHTPQVARRYGISYR